MNKIKTLVLPLAGKGTRMRPVSSIIPKEMLPVNNVPTVEIVLREALEIGIEKVILIISQKKQIIVEYLKQQGLLNDIEFRVLYQTTPAGLGDAILCAKNHVDNFFYVALVDEVVENGLKQLNSAFKNKKSNYLLVTEVPKKATHKYGIVVFDDNNKVKHMIEKPKLNTSPSNFAIIGRYILNNSIFDMIEKLPKPNGELQLTDAMVKLNEQENFFASVFNGRRFDCGNSLGLTRANLYYLTKLGIDV